MKTRKVVVMGFRAVGKSSVTQQFTQGSCSENYHPTIEDTFRKVIEENGVSYDTAILDTAGQDEYSPFTNRYVVGVHGYILIYAVNSRDSFEMLEIINEKILNESGCNSVPRILVGNKIDLEGQRKVTTAEGKAKAEEWGCAFVETSAKENVNVEQAFLLLINEIKRHQSGNTNDPDKRCIIL
eukprot:CAMPEP_0168523410 /NCGR_PEP_ID=MMETSP0405-20121227/9964_1 /TAXON_ID=498012 /ORGANISM="Trichosphaerium sp, Strain Am-I-7 wt" /LENGTH=182 /DNA_ID=CAMNT_0008545273 /DNA_START=73 /DNA_END=621 /DNA_ORIENTATION=-